MHGTDAEKQVTDAFAAFEQSLRLALTAEARQAVDVALERLGGGDSPFTIRSVEIDVTIRSLTLETAGAAAPAPRSRVRRTAPDRRGGTRGRPPGQLRTAIEGAFAAPETELTVDGLRDYLTQRGLSTSSDNLHQHLRRLVKAGALERSGRGTYRAAAPA